MLDTERFDRLFRGLGEKGLATLQKSLISVVYNSPIGKYFAYPFSLSGCPVRLISTAKTGKGEMFFDAGIGAGPSSRQYEKTLRKFNGGNVVGIEAELGYHGMDDFLAKSSLIIDCTGISESQKNVIYFSKKNKIPAILADVIPGYGVINLIMPKSKNSDIEFENLGGLEEKVKDKDGALLTKELVACFLAGISANEGVKAILGKEGLLDRKLYLKFGHGYEMFNKMEKDEGPIVISPETFNDVSAMIFGVGAVGTNIGYWLGRANPKVVDALDKGLVKITNVGRQLFYYDSVGMPKSNVFSEKIKRISNADSFPYLLEMNESWKPPNKYSVYFDGFDSFSSRYFVHNRGLIDKVPIVSASGRFDGFDIEMFVPGRTLCFDCSYGIEKKAKEDIIRRQNACGEEFTPQNSWINLSIGPLGVFLASTIFSDDYGPPINGIIFYDPNQPSRLYIDRMDGVCKIKKKGTVLHDEKKEAVLHNG